MPWQPLLCFTRVARNHNEGNRIVSMKMITPVTPKLAAELAATGSLLASLGDSNRNNNLNSTVKINDRDCYVQVVNALEALAVAALAATSSVPLTAMATQPGARFDMGANSSLAHQVTESVAYLRETASELLARGGFSQYKRDATNVALGLLKGLFGTLQAGIIRQVAADLETVKANGVNDLLTAANTLAKLAAAKAPEGFPSTEPVGLVAKLEARETDAALRRKAQLEAREARVGTWNPAG